MSRTTISQTNGQYPRASLQNADTAETLVTMIDEHAAALDNLETAVTPGGARWSTRAGTPEAHVVGSPGDLCSDTTNGELYIKHTGSATNTGWTLVTHA